MVLTAALASTSGTVKVLLGRESRTLCRAPSRKLCRPRAFTPGAGLNKQAPIAGDQMRNERFMGPFLAPEGETKA